MAAWTSTTVSLSRSAAIRTRLGRGVILLAGLALAVAGWQSLDRTWHSAEWVAAADGLRGGGETMPPARLEAGIKELQRLQRPQADELGALAFLHYAAAENALAANDGDGWRWELSAAAAAARQSLILAPTRADLALVLAEAEFLQHGATAAVYPPLALSYRTAPRELWIAQRRIALGLRLLAVAPREIAEDVTSDIRILGEPFRDSSRYQLLAEAALVAGPAAVTAVERELGRGHPWPFQLFEQDLAELSAKRGLSATARPPQPSPR
ncbi:MAG TPA: hypothetical protein VHU15_17080 [Stellaceae bacterium]|nr:hypothetical protein [Stellaceae bacterium]